MCLGIPVRIEKISKNSATVTAAGVKKKIGIELNPKVKVGDYVLLHAGFAISVISGKQAKETFALFKQMYKDTRI